MFIKIIVVLFVVKITLAGFVIFNFVIFPRVFECIYIF